MPVVWNQADTLRVAAETTDVLRLVLRCRQTTLQNKYGLLFQGYINISVLTLELVMS